MTRREQTRLKPNIHNVRVEKKHEIELNQTLLICNKTYTRQYVRVWQKWKALKREK